MATSARDAASKRAPSRPVPMRRVGRYELLDLLDAVAVEEPLEIRLISAVNGVHRERSVAVTMRTPGHDSELAAGFLFTEGLLTDPRDVLLVRPCRNGNRVRVYLRDGVSIDVARLKRHFYTSSSCGVCGKASIEAVRVCRALPFSVSDITISSEVIRSLPPRLRQTQLVFERTGGLHGCALFTTDGELIDVREDVGRHNALDKLIGRQFLTGKTPLQKRVLLLSGRISFELVQKAAVAGIPVVVAIGAPSSLAIDLAAEVGMTLIGFVRDDRFNVYTGGQRIT